MSAIGTVDEAPPIADAEVAAAFEAFDPALREALLALRALIFEVAAETEGAGRLEETLKWGQPSYLTVAPRSGSTIRIGARKDEPEGYAVFFHCRTSLVETFRAHYRDRLSFEGNRAILLRLDTPLPEPELRHCIALALTYRRAKARSSRV